MPLFEPADSPQSIARAATITSLGSLTSRLVGIGRDSVKSYFFGNGGHASAFELASTPPTLFNDLLVGGMLSSSLVPTFSGPLGAQQNKPALEAFGQLLGALIGLVFGAISLIIAVLWLFAEPLAALLSGGRTELVDETARLLRITIPAILFLNFSGILTAVLQARRRFNLTAFTATTYNLVMIGMMVLLGRQLGINSLAIGLLMGSIAQVILQLPGLRGIPIRVSLNWRHPGIAHILKLYAPVAGGLALAQIAALISFALASRISEQGPVTMRYAANVIQFPLGMVASAVGAAILPTLSTTRSDEFSATLARGLRLVSVLIVPATIGLFILALPVVGVLYEHGEFTPESTAYTALALRAAVPNLFFSAIDRLLIFGFYARHNTRTPTLIGLVSTVLYLILVGSLTALDASSLRTFTLFDLILSDSLKTGVDMILMGTFLSRSVGSLRGNGLTTLLSKVIFAASIMGIGVWQAMIFLQSRLGDVGRVAHIGVAVGAAVMGALLYVIAANLLRVPELSITKLRARLIGF